MNAAELVSKVMAIEREVDCLERSRLKEMLAQVADGLLEIEWQTNLLARENQMLQLRLDAIRQGDKPWPRIARWKQTAVSAARLRGAPAPEPAAARAANGAEEPRGFRVFRRWFPKSGNAEKQVVDPA